MALPRNRYPLPKCDAFSRATIVYTIVYRTPYKRRYPCSTTSLDPFQSAELLNSVVKWQKVGAKPAKLLNSVVEQQRVGVEAPCEYSDEYSDVVNAWCCRNVSVKVGNLYQYKLILVVVRRLLNTTMGLLNRVKMVEYTVDGVGV